MKERQFFHFIVNPAAGKRRKLSAIADIENFFHERNLPFHIEVTTEPGEATQLAQRAAEHARVVVAVGGDGTVNEVASGLLGATGVTLGILPIGSGNDFAHQLGYGRNTTHNLEMLVSQHTKEIDVGKVNNKHIFVNAFGVGFDAYVAGRFKQYKHIVGGFPAYLFAVLRILPFYCFRNAQIHLDEKDMLITPLLLAAVCNGTTYGGGFKIAPQARMDDGLLTLCCIKKMSRLYALGKLPALVKGTHTTLEQVITRAAKKLVIDLERPTVAQIDGEILPPERRFSIMLLPRALSVIYHTM